MDEKVQTICGFEEDKLAELAANDEWWANAVAWYNKNKTINFSEIPEVQKGWIAQMKVRYGKDAQ